MKLPIDDVNIEDEKCDIHHIKCPRCNVNITTTKPIDVDLTEESLRIIREVVTTGKFTLSDGTQREVANTQILNLAKKFVEKSDGQEVDESKDSHIPKDMSDIFGLK